MSADELYQVLYFADGRETLSDPAPLADAEATARALDDDDGPRVGSVMTVDNARRYMAYRHAPVYRGIPVPGRLRSDDAPREWYEVWKQGVDAALRAVVPLVEALSSGEPCALNGYGICEVHDLAASPPCPDGEAQKFLAASRKDTVT